MPLIQDLIASAGGQLTPTDRRIAEVVLRDPTLLAFGTVSDLASRVETSRPSVVRFANRLGFEGYSDLQGRVREEMARQLGRPAERIRRGPGEEGSIRATLGGALEATLAALDEARLDALAAPLVRAREVWILSGETSRAAGHVLRSGLSMVRPGVRLVEDHARGRDLSGAGSEDAAVVIDFPRYRRSTLSTARALAAVDVPIVALTDGAFSPYAALTRTWCALAVPAVGPFDSSVPPVVAAELLVARVATALGDAARARIDRLEAMWLATETFADDGATGRR